MALLSIGTKRFKPFYMQVLQTGFILSAFLDMLPISILMRAFGSTSSASSWAMSVVLILITFLQNLPVRKNVCDTSVTSSKRVLFNVGMPFSFLRRSQ